MVALNQFQHGREDGRLVQVGHVVFGLAAGHDKRIQGDLLLLGHQQGDFAARHAAQLIEPVGIEVKAKFAGRVRPSGEVQRHGVHQGAVEVKYQALKSG